MERGPLDVAPIEGPEHLADKLRFGIPAHPWRKENTGMDASSGTMNRVSNGSGGAAAAGGLGFQAKLGAIAGIHMLRGTPVQWTDGLTRAAPCAVSFETAGPGDDLSLELTDGNVVEIQTKRGLRADGRFWSALDALCEGIRCNRCSFGILIVCPHSSLPVRRAYALALERIGDGRNDSASPEQKKLANRLARKGYDADAVCARIRIRMVSALEDAGDAIAAARSELGHVCADDRQVTPAWHALCQDSLSAMATKGRRTLRDLSAYLHASGINIQGTVKDSPVAISDGLLQWTISRTEHFQVPGISRPLPTDQAWLPLTAVVRDASIEPACSVEQALADYHALGERSRTDGHVIDAKTIGTFRKLCVVVGGPGSGKSLLLRVLAREFAKDSYVSIRVRLRDLATRMQETGCGVEEGLLQLGLDGTGISREQLRAASLSELVLLCDGLDECGEREIDIASGLRDISASHPSFRIIVTTRPIGYSTTELHNWRHYEIAPLAEADTAKHLETLCRCALDQESAEKAHDLLPQIRNYLKEGAASQILARSPLLLAFGAALFLSSRRPSRTKLELYQRIFHLIDATPAGRETAPKPPAKAIRSNILNQLGWLTAAAPLQAAEELEKHCAKTIEQDRGVSYLQALIEVEATITYWEEKGLIERLQHPGIDLITFIHKTFGEFAAALHLSEMKSDEVRQAITTALSKPDWNEILDLATGTSLAKVLAELLITEFEAVDPDESTLNRLFRVLVRPETSLSPGQRKSFLKRIFALARSEDRQKAYRVGLCLTEHDISRMPEAEQMASALVAAPTEWSQLVGWAVLACHFPDNVRRSALEDALAHFMERSRTKEFFVLQDLKLPIIGPLPDRGIFENFLHGALKLLLPDQNAEYQDRLIDNVWKSQPNATMEFESRFRTLLKELGREDASSPTYPSRFFESFKFSRPDKFDKGYAVVLTEVVPAAFLKHDAGPPLATGLKCLAALFQLAGIMRVPADDVYVWLSDDTRLDGVHALLRAAAYIYELPAERLAAEATQATVVGESLRQEWNTKSLLEVLPIVDVAEVDWSRASEFDIDMRVVQGLVHHPSQWIQRLAALIINERLEGAARRSACERMLAAGTGDALHWAAALTAGLPDGCAVLLRRLSGPNTAGLHHLFASLKEQGCRISPSHLAVVEKGLLHCGAETAVSAARWCEATASTTDSWLVDLLRSASIYWLENEEPYPDNGGIVPDSPREALLRTLCGIAPPTFEELVQLASDQRSDVREAAIDGVIGLAGDFSDQRLTLLESILAKRFSPSQCEKLLDTSVPYRSDELSRLCQLCGDEDPAFRLVAVRRVLTRREMDREKALAAADCMRRDKNGNVRDVVHHFLDREAENGQLNRSGPPSGQTF